MSIVPHASSAIAHGRGRLVLLGNSMGTPRIPARRGGSGRARPHRRGAPGRIEAVGHSGRGERGANDTDPRG
ncbi:hypothetical protein ACIO14_04495 [Nocardia fluminea]|uniref:hypothetical protein n=1 Tax=Nocardia fluminea TaxID=134984 RepID=UPI003817788B